ncbi:hypothetical protein ACIOZL_31090 [Streptomyces sp. NPDC087769]|uniref:hypothetical protein n=1 Tax=Streptomyces sp. NPDC087769 TaxID=3365802 RepID=UPI0037F50CA3
MTAHRRPLPSRADVSAAVDALTAETGRAPSVLALATRLGLANTTFRRNFPTICAELTRSRPATGAATSADAFTALKTEHARPSGTSATSPNSSTSLSRSSSAPASTTTGFRVALHDVQAVTVLSRCPR